MPAVEREEDVDAVSAVEGREQLVELVARSRGCSAMEELEHVLRRLASRRLHERNLVKLLPAIADRYHTLPVERLRQRDPKQIVGHHDLAEGGGPRARRPAGRDAERLQ